MEAYLFTILAASLPLPKNPALIASYIDLCPWVLLALLDEAMIEANIIAGWERIG